MKPTFRTILFVFMLSSVPSVSVTPDPPEDCSGMGVRLRTFRLVTYCNVTTLKEKQLMEIQAPATNLYPAVLYLLAFCVGLPSNLLALWVLVYRTKHLPSTVLLINLTLVDLLLLMVLPFRIVYHLRGNNWELGEPFCRLVTAIFYGNMYGSIWCLAMVALDRYLALVHPFKAMSLRSWNGSVCLTGMVWMVMLGAMLPLLVSQQTYKLMELNITTCHDALPEKIQDNYFLPYFSTLFALCFLLPFVIVVFCHSAVLRTLLVEGKQYTHAIGVTVLVLVVFIVCLLPSNVLLLLTYTEGWMDGFGEDLYVPYMISLAFSTWNSCINPFIFYFVSSEFRQKAMGALCHCSQRESQSCSQGNTSSSSAKRSKVTLLSVTNRQHRSEMAFPCQQDKGMSHDC